MQLFFMTTGDIRSHGNKNPIVEMVLSKYTSDCVRKWVLFLWIADAK